MHGRAAGDVRGWIVTRLRALGLGLPSSKKGRVFTLGMQWAGLLRHMLS
jgi:hypothetical protein